MSPPKGSITVDGVSLTVNEVDDTAAGVEFDAQHHPAHRGGHYVRRRSQPGQAVNIEIDVLARYLQRMEALRRAKA